MYCIQEYSTSSKCLIMHFDEVLLVYFPDCIQIVRINKQLANKILCLLEGDSFSPKCGMALDKNIPGRVACAWFCHQVLQTWCWVTGNKINNMSPDNTLHSFFVCDLKVVLNAHIVKGNTTVTPFRYHLGKVSLWVLWIRGKEILVWQFSAEYLGRF